MVGEWHKAPFEKLLIEPVRNGIYKTKGFHGRGAKIVNMGELFALKAILSSPVVRLRLKALGSAASYSSWTKRLPSSRPSFGLAQTRKRRTLCTSTTFLTLQAGFTR